MARDMPLGNLPVNVNLPDGHGHGLPVGICGRMENRIKQLRKEKGWTQGQLAERAGVDTSYISRLETGKRGKGRGGKSGPTYSIVKSIADALDVDVRELGGDEAFDIGAEAVENAGDAPQTDRERRFIAHFRSLTESQQEAWLHLLEDGGEPDPGQPSKGDGKP